MLDVDAWLQALPLPRTAVLAATGALLMYHSRTRFQETRTFRKEPRLVKPCSDAAPQAPCAARAARDAAHRPNRRSGMLPVPIPCAYKSHITTPHCCFLRHSVASVTQARRRVAYHNRRLLQPADAAGNNRARHTNTQEHPSPGNRHYHSRCRYPHITTHVS